MKDIKLFDEVKKWARGPVLNHDEGCAKCWKNRKRGTIVYWDAPHETWFCSEKCCDLYHKIHFDELLK